MYRKRGPGPLVGAEPPPGAAVLHFSGLYQIPFQMKQAH